MRTMDLRGRRGGGPAPPRTKSWQGTALDRVSLSGQMLWRRRTLPAPSLQMLLCTPLSFPASLQGLSVSLGLPLRFYSWNSHCGCLWVSVGGPRGLRRPSLLPTCHTSSSHFLPELPETPHTMDLGTPRPRLTPMKGTQPKRVRGSPEVTQPD